MNQGPLSREEKKKIAEEYMAIQKSIIELTEKAEKMYADFTPSMQDYVKKATEHEKMKKGIEQKINRLEEIDKKMGEMHAGIKLSNEEMRRKLQGGKESTFVPHNASLAEKETVNKNKTSEDKENIPPVKHSSSARPNRV